MRRIRFFVLSVPVVLLVVALGGCGSSPLTGTLKVTVGGLPVGVNGDVVVIGPGGYSTTLPATTTLPSLTPGSYTVKGKTTVYPNAIVDTAYTAAGGGAVTVGAGTTASSSVSYSLLQGSGKLWVADEGGAIDGILAAAANPTRAVTLNDSNGPDGLALDANGNLWVGMTGNSTVVEFTASQLASSDTPTPKVTIGSDGTSLAYPASLAFDAQGNLWVGNVGGRIEMYTPSQLAASNTLSPSVAITGTYTQALGLAFDASGDLWFSEPVNSHVDEYTPSQLASSGSRSPNVTLNIGAVGLAFDANGNLWAANCTGNDLTMYTPKQIAAGGSQTATVTISDDGSFTLGCTESLALDDGGDLWVSQTNNTVLEYAAGDIAQTGHPAPAVVLTGFTGLGVAQLLFDPPPSKLPLYH